MTMTRNHRKTPTVANCSKNAGKNKSSDDKNVKQGSTSATASTELMKLQMEYLQKEHSIKMKAIADREAAELSFARKEYHILKSRLVGNGADDDDNCFDNATAEEDGANDLDHVSPPVAFEYASSNISSSSAASSTAPTPQQVCARQVMPPDLPTFSGDPEEWPVFYSQYKNTTMACGYSNSENLIRLQRCLKGQALEFVRSRLLLPNLVPKVIDTLKMLYGRPTVIIESLINKVRTIQSPEMDRLETIIVYGIAIRNLVDHLIAMEQTAHLQNPTLLQELVAKLPGEMKLQWAQYKRQRESSSLDVLCDFMDELVGDACEVTNIRSQAQRMEDDSDGESFGNTHSVSYNTNGACVVCKDQHHRVQDCDEFKSFDVSRRWRLVGELKLCRCCLNRRHAAGVCHNAYECGIERCQSLHHPLLHQTRLRQDNHLVPRY